MKKMLKLISNGLILLTVCFLIGGSVIAAENTDSDQFSGFGISTGFGHAYGGMGGGALEYYIPMKGYHGITGLAGTGYGPELVGAAATIRYSYGVYNRFITDVTFGKIGEESTEKKEYNPSTDSWKTIEDETENLYGPALLLGYQRMTSFGLTFSIAIGACIDIKNDSDIFPALTMGLGYKF